MAIPKILREALHDATISPEKFHELTLWLRAETVREAARAFDAAFLKMQPQIPQIDEHGEIEYPDGRQGTYALNEDIQAAVGPILNLHGFYLTFETTSHRGGDVLTVKGILTHRRGHSRFSVFTARPDLSGDKTPLQGRGSVISYAHRYTTIDLLNIITRGVDTDGATPENPVQLGPIPEGFQDFSASLYRAVLAGSAALQAAWGAGFPEQRRYVPLRHWRALKETAATADAMREAI